MKAGKEMFPMTMNRRRAAAAPASSTAAPPVRSFSSREAFLDSAQAVALADPAFHDLIAKADVLRDGGHWQAAADAYGDALKLHPYERSYWTQLGHMLKEQGYFGLAEITYRTGAAFGADPQDVRSHLRFVMDRQGVSEHQYPIRFHESVVLQRQLPGRPDLLAFARLLWGQHDVDDGEQLALLRRCGSLDDLAAAMIADPRFERGNRAWLELVQEDEL